MKQGLTHKMQPARMFEQLTIKRKLVAIIMLISVTASLVVGGSLTVYKLAGFRGRMATDLSTLTEIVADNCQGALVFEDQMDAGDVLQSLQAKGSVEQAIVFLPDGSVFASYFRDQDDSDQGIAAFGLDGDSLAFTRDGLHVWRSIRLAEREIGSIYMRSELSELSAFLNQSIFVLLFSLLLTLGVAYWLSNRLQRIFSTPVSHLVDVTRRISQDNDYSVRAITGSMDELGQLTEAFNDMLTQIEYRDAHLLASRARFNQLVENIPELFWLGSADWENILYISPAYESIWGRSCQSLYDNPSSWLDGIVAEDRSEIAALVAKDLTQTREVIAWPTFRIEQPGGDTRWISIRIFPILDEQGVVYRMAGIAEDITERKQAEDAVRQSEEKFRRFSENLKEEYFFYSHDLEGKFRYLSPSITNILGYQPEDFSKHYAEYLTDHPVNESVARTINVSTEKLPQSSYEAEIHHRDGTVHRFEMHEVPVCDEPGQVVAIEGIAHDITERLKIEDQLRQSQKMEAIGTLAGGIAHDFNNILTAILGYSELAMTEIPDSMPVKSNIGNIVKAGIRAKDLVAQILSFSRKEAKGRSSIQVHLVVNEALQFLRASIPTTIEIKQSIDPKSGNILADPTQIHQVVINLCTNAAQAMSAAGGILKVDLTSVEITDRDLADPAGESAMSPRSYVKLSVSDNGKGIEAKDIDRIFDPYFTTKEIGKGTGMGLAVVNGIVSSHEGTIKVDSSPDRGTTFNLLFPRIAEPSPEKSKTIDSIPTGSEKVLVVDDEKAVADLTKKMLEHLGYSVTAITSSLEALELFTSQPHAFDIVLSDQTMPGMTGDMLVRKILEIRPDIPTVICSGYSSEMDAETAENIGVSAYLMKPTGMRKLGDTLRSVLDSETTRI
ncbi:MAG: PAS domain S-box protein [bacterium]|nr:PAS domain S-box protein [bacterium]